MSIAVIADIVGSRRLTDRAAAQRDLDAVIAAVERDLPLAREPFAPTVGDEQQATYESLDDALASILLLQLTLPDGIDCRFGIGIGTVGSVTSAHGEIPEGPGWWAARDAIDAVHGMQQRAAPRARTWVVAHQEEDEAMHTIATMANAYLLARDQLVGTMNERTRRLTHGRCLRMTQGDLARQEGISQPAVSQALASTGATAIVEGFRALRAGAHR